MTLETENPEPEAVVETPAVETAKDESPETEKDWRADFSSDEKVAKYLGRYATLGDFVADSKKKNDEILRRAGMVLPEKPTDDELAAFRKEQGVPDHAEGYLAELPNGLVVGDDDRPAVDQFINAMHGVNAPKPVVDAALSAYYSIVESQVEAQEEADSEGRNVSDAALRGEWRGDYERNMNVVSGYLATLPETVRTALDTARGADGVTIGNKTEIIKWVASLALQANPLATVVPGLGQTAINQVEDEIAAIEKTMGTPAYTKNEKIQARYRDLVDARLRAKPA